MKMTRARKGGVTLHLEPVEAGVLRQLAEDLLTLLGPAQDPGADPLLAAVGIGSGERPTHPALLRLLPDLYATDSPEGRAAAHEARRYTEPDLRAGKREAAESVLAWLPEQGGKVAVGRDACDPWLTHLTDVRLMLGTLLDVTDDPEAPDPLADPDLPEELVQAHAVYAWLGYLQEVLLSHLTPRTG